MNPLAETYFGTIADGLEATLTPTSPEMGLVEYSQEAWRVVEPNTEYIHNWHVDAIGEHLEAITLGELTRLVINVPPRFMKSLLVSVFWPTWWWTFAPWLRFIFGSYAQTLSTRDSVRSRRILQSKWYRENWGHVFALTTDQNVKSRYENDRTGLRLATSVHGIGTGEGGDVLCTDDPHNVLEGESDTKREETVRWLDEVTSTRLNNPEKGARVIIMQRVHERDSSGHVLEQGGWEHLMIPMEYEATRHCTTSIGWTDPRSTDGELAWPSRFTRKAVDRLKVELGPYGTAGQLQQRPAPRSGGMFDRDWFDVVAVPPPSLWYVAYMDKAGTKEGGKYSVLALLGMNLSSGHVWIVDMHWGKWAMADREKVLDDNCDHWARLLGGKSGFKLWVEQEPGSGGKDSALLTVQRLTRMGYLADVDPAVANKFTRADHFAGAAKAKMVHLVEGDWNEVFKRQIAASGPGADDLGWMDVCSGAYNKLLEVREEQGGEEYEEMFDFDDEGGFRT